MKPKDIFAVLFIGVVLSIFLIPETRKLYNAFYIDYPILLSFLKFSLLATFGEMLILRIFRGKYSSAEFGLVPKFFVWGILGISLYFAFTIFYGGVTWLVFKGEVATGSLLVRIAHAFLISFFMNIFYAPILMLSHHISDLHIIRNNGRFPVSNFQTLTLLKAVDWDKMWSFVIKRTIPLFWIPVHTITFLLPEQYRVLIAAVLSIVLGLFLATTKKKN